MIKSALIESARGREAKCRATSESITRAALLLTDEHGLDGFTMDDLAESSGVSRRTLFNYFPSKIDAILGEQHLPPEELLAEFRSGGPSGVLMDDLRTLLSSLLETRPITTDELMRMHRLVRSEPRIVHAAHQRMVDNVAQFAELLVDREGPSLDPRNARLIGRLVVAVFDDSMEIFAADPAGSDIAELVDDGLRRLTTLFR